MQGKYAPVNIRSQNSLVNGFKFSTFSKVKTMKKKNVASVTIQQFGKALAGNIIAGVPTMVKSHPGIGKTTGCEWVFNKLASKFPGGFHVLSTNARLFI